MILLLLSLHHLMKKLSLCSSLFYSPTEEQDGLAPLCTIPLRGDSTPGYHGGWWQWDMELLLWLTPQATGLVIFTGSYTQIFHYSNRKKHLV